MKILFTSVDGVQNYLKSLFLPILSKVQDENIDFEILEFCPNDDNLRQDIVNASTEYEVPVHFGTYFNIPPVIGSFIFIVYGAIRTVYVVNENKIDILMPRSLLAGAMALLVRMIFRKVEIIYESDGLMSDERVDFGSWSKTGLIYRFFQMIEKKLVRDSKIVITRTHKAKGILLERSPSVDAKKIVVIPNGKDKTLFRTSSQEVKTEIHKKYNIKDDDLLLIYVGSIGKQYRPDVMLDIFRELRETNSNIKFLILTPNQEEMATLLSSSLSDTKDVFIDRVDPNEISSYIAVADIGMALRTPSLSQQAVCPLKVIEYLMCGIPVITNSGVGDMDELFDNNKLGYIIENLDDVNYKELTTFVMDTANDLDNNMIRNVAVDHFDLNTIVELYRSSLSDLS